MARRRKYTRRRGSWLSNIDLGLSPEKIRDILVIGLGIFGFVLLLSLFDYAGNIGIYFAVQLENYFGLLKYFLPIILIYTSALMTFPDRFNLKVISYLGMGLLLIALAGLTYPSAGLYGNEVRQFFDQAVGPIVAFILLIGLGLISILLIFDTSLAELRERFFPEGEEADIKVHNHTEPESQKVSVFATVKNKIGLNKNKVAVNQQPTTTPKPLSQPIIQGDWELPPIDLLEVSNSRATPGNITNNVEKIQKTLRDFSIDVSMGDVNVGPTVTQYTLKPKEGIKLNQITARANDLSLALAAHPLRIEAPIPGKAAVGVEVPNKVAAVVTLREVIESEEFKKSKSNLSIALGRDVAGTPVIIDLKKMPHLLIAGATGSGKSICINGIIFSLLYQNSPADLRMILVDPKRVEFTRYDGITHLLCPVITEVDKTINALKWAVGEMERRFKLFSQSGRRDIDSYNANPTQGKMPYLVIVIDELADLMAQSAREVEAAIVRLAQMARAVGIHLIVATQRPSVDVITGLIKANIISRIAFAVASQIDSRTILDLSGAEKLLGRGDMLYVSPELGKPKRVQGVFVSEKEVNSITDFIKSKNPPQYDESIMNFASQRGAMGASGVEIDDNLFEQAKEIVIQAGKASASLLQRRLRVGYARAARLLDLLEAEGIIGQADGAKPRDVMIGPEELAAEKNLQQSYQSQYPSPTANWQNFVQPGANLNQNNIDTEEEEQVS